MEIFFRTHRYLIEHTRSPVRRNLMDEIDWNDRLIGIKGTRGVGKTTFLLQYAKEKFGTDTSCLYVNMNNFYFFTITIFEFAKTFYKQGGRVLLIDQVFKYPNWSEELRACYDQLPGLRIVFTGSSVMRLKEENQELSGIVKSYNLRGFSFREFLNLQTDNRFKEYTLEEILKNHTQIATEICSTVDPLDYFHSYIHHGFYPFYLEKRNFSENLLKTMNMVIEVDISLVKQIEQKYLPKIKKLFYLLSILGDQTPNVSKLATELQISRATVMNYIKYLSDARLINILYPKEEQFPKKPAQLFLHNTNLMYAIFPIKMEQQALLETFFLNALYKDHLLNQAGKGASFLVDNLLTFSICTHVCKKKRSNHQFVALSDLKVGGGNQIPIWLFGFLY